MYIHNIMLVGNDLMREYEERGKTKVHVNRIVNKLKIPFLFSYRKQNSVNHVDSSINIFPERVSGIT